MGLWKWGNLLYASSFKGTWWGLRLRDPEGLGMSIFLMGS